MNSKFLRFSFLVFQLLVFILGIGICIFGLVKTDTLASGYSYLTAVARIIILLLVSATYFKMSGSSFSQGSAFMMLCIFCLSFAELRVLGELRTPENRSRKTAFGNSGRGLRPGTIFGN